MQNAAEIFDVVDEKDRVIDRRPRAEVHRLGLRHRAVHVLVFNAEGELLLQKRAAHKDCNPGLWDTSVGGHLQSGEEYAAAATRETAEELGFTPVDAPELLFKLDACAETGMEFIQVYELHHDGEVTPQESEIDQVRWVGAAELERWMADQPQAFTSSLHLIWKTLSGAR